MSRPGVEVTDDQSDLLSRYSEFRLCRDFGLTPQQLESIPANVIDDWIYFTSEEPRAKAEASEKAARDSQRRSRKGM